MAPTDRHVPVIDLADDLEQVAHRDRRGLSPRSASSRSSGTASTPTIEQAAWDAAHDFFALPLERQAGRSAIPPGDAYGYGPFQVERLAASLGDGHAARPQGDVLGRAVRAAAARSRRSGGGVRVFAQPLAGAAARRWSPPSAHTTTSMAVLVARVMSLMAIGLELDARLLRSPSIDRHTSALRALHYPDLGGQRDRARPAAGGRPLRLRHADVAAPGRRAGWPAGARRRRRVARRARRRRAPTSSTSATRWQRWTNDRWRQHGPSGRGAAARRRSRLRALLDGVLPQRQLGRGDRMHPDVRRRRASAQVPRR